jgi:hypothetical protein
LSTAVGIKEKRSLNGWEHGKPKTAGRQISLELEIIVVQEIR